MGGAAIQGYWSVRRGPRSIPSPSPGLVPAAVSVDPGLRGSVLPPRSGLAELTSPGVPPPGPARRFGSPRAVRGGWEPAQLRSSRSLYGAWSSGRILSPATPRPRVAAPPPSRTIGNYRRLPLLAPWRTRSAAPEPGLPRPIRFSACSQTPRARHGGGAGAGPFLAPFRSTPGPQPSPVLRGQLAGPDGTVRDHELLRACPAYSGQAWLTRGAAVRVMREASKGYRREPRQPTGAWPGGVACGAGRLSSAPAPSKSGPAGECRSIRG